MSPAHGTRSLATASLLIAAACGAVPGPAPDGGAPDAGHLDAGHLDAGGSDAGASAPDGGRGDGGVELLDWRTMRGPALQPVVVGEFPGRPYALSDATFALELGCDGGACDREWRDDAGAVVATRRNLRAVFSSSVSPDRRTAALLEVAGQGTCVDADTFTHGWWQGSWTLVALDTGAVLSQLPPSASQDLIGSAYLSQGRHQRLFPFDPQGCIDLPPLVLATTPPYLAPPILASLTDAYADDELPDGRLVLFQRPERLALAQPSGAGGVERISDTATSSISTGRWHHAFQNFFVASVTSYDGQAHRGTTSQVPIAEDDFQAEAASHRFAAVCSPSPGLDHLFRCQVLDGEGVLPRVDVRVGRLGHSRPLALAGQAGFFVHASADGGLVRRDLLDGGVTALGLPATDFRVVGDGRAVIAASRDTLWGVTRDQVLPFEGRGVAVLAPEWVGARSDLPQSPVIFLLASSASGAETWLTAWNVAEGRVVRLTDSLLFNPPFGQPWSNPTDCAVPGFVRTAGPPGDSIFQAADWLHFTEFVPSPTPTLEVFVMPVDLSRPPRLLGELDPAHCAPPLASRSGRRLWLPVPTSTGLVRAVLATP